MEREPKSSVCYSKGQITLDFYTFQSRLRIDSFDSTPSNTAKNALTMTSSSKRSDKAPKPVTASSKTMPAKRTSFLSGLAVFGDSIWALILSFCLLVVAVGVALYLDTETTAKDPADVAYAKLPPTPKIGPAKVYEVDITNNIDQLFVTKQMRLAFEQDGVIAVRGLLTDEEMDMLEQASNQIVLGERQEQDKNRSNRGRSERQFHTVVQGAIFMEKEDTPNASMTGFRQVALFSNIPQVAAELLNLKNKEGTSNASNETMRLLRDIFLAKDSDQFICGWHVRCSCMPLGPVRKSFML